MEHDAANQLHVERDHVPRKGVPANLLGRAHQMPAGILQKRKRLGKDRIKRSLHDSLLLILVRILRHRLRNRLRNPRLQFRRPLREVLIRQVFGLQLLL